jgi:hypothetical protein
MYSLGRIGVLIIINNHLLRSKIFSYYRSNGRRRLGRPLKRLLDEAETGLSRPNSWRMLKVKPSWAPPLNLSEEKVEAGTVFPKGNHILYVDMRITPLGVPRFCCLYLLLGKEESRRNPQSSRRFPSRFQTCGIWNQVTSQSWFSPSSFSAKPRNSFRDRHLERV